MAGVVGMSDSDDLKYVVGWSLGGIVASALVLGAYLVVLQAPSSPAAVVTERSLDSLDQQTCRRMMQTFVDQSRSGTQILWLWAEESSSKVFGSGPLTKQVVGGEKPPRPYAFHPGSQSVPETACSFPRNSVHVVAVEPGGKSGTLISDYIE